MNLPGVYLDEDTQSDALIAALRSRAVSVLTTSEAGNGGRTDHDQLRFATARRLVLVTSNVEDFARIHFEVVSAQNESHAGIIVIQQQRWGPGELARRIIRLLVSTTEGGGMQNRLEFISHW